MSTKKINHPGPIRIGLGGAAKSEAPLVFGAVTALIFWTLGADWLKGLESPLAAAFYFLWLFGVMLWLSFGVVRHAECLAVKMGEPYGTLILTLAVTGIEVIMISAVMMTGKDNPTVARDTMFSVIMIILNGILGLTLLLGGLKHREQEYNLSGARSYLVVLVAIGSLCLIMPRFTTSAPGGQPSHLMAFFLITVSAMLYGAFLLLQTSTHSHFFKGGDDAKSQKHPVVPVRSAGFHAALLVATMLPIVLLSKKAALVVDFGINEIGAPYALAGFIVAVLVLSPESLAAIRAALDNQLQRTVNIAFGSALATISLTIPSVLVIGEITGKTIEIGLDQVDIALLGITFFVAAINFGGTRTNFLGGVVHLVLFFSFLVLMFD